MGRTTIECCMRWCANEMYFLRYCGNDDLLSLDRQHGQLVVDALFNRQPVQRLKQRVDV